MFKRIFLTQIWILFKVFPIRQVILKFSDL